MTTVWDLNGQGHTILTIKTDRGGFILDDLTDEIEPRVNESKASATARRTGAGDR